MKNNIKKILIILLVFVSFISINKIKADSGWDSSYGGGGGSSYSSGSSSSSSFDYDGGSSSRSGPTRKLTEAEKRRNLIIFNIIVCIVILIFIIFAIKLRKISEKEKNRYNEISEDELKKYFDKDLIELKKEFYDKFIKIQEAWMNFDYDSLKKLCSNEIYNTYYEELEALKIKNGKNIMSNFEKVEDRIISIKEENNNIVVDYYLKVLFYDYVINNESGDRIKGSKLYRLNNTYIITYTISNNKIVSNCPNCGAEIEVGTTTCSHCKAVIVQDSNEFVMTSKRRI